MELLMIAVGYRSVPLPHGAILQNGPGSVQRWGRFILSYLTRRM
jgi:hypothetical protein